MVEKTWLRNWSKKTKFFAYFGVIFCCLFFFSNTVFSAAPTMISYQGKLLQSGSQVSGAKQIIFSLYDSATGGNVLYTAGGMTSAPAPVSVNVTNGIFTINFGDSGTNPLDPDLFKNNGNIYLQVSIDGEDLLPRKQITSYPYAFSSLYANTSTYANTAGVAENANNANTSTYANTAGTSTYAQTAGSSLSAGTSTWSNTSSYALNSGLFGGMSTSSFATSSHGHNLSVLNNDVGFVTSSGARSAISAAAASHISYTASTGIITVASGYNIPLTVSTTYWQTYSAIVSSTYNNWNTAYTLANQWNVASSSYLTTTTASSTYLQKTVAALLYAPIIHAHATSDITSGIFGLSRGGTGTSTFASGGLVFSDGTKLTQNSNQLYWDDANGSLDIGTNVSVGGSILNVVGTSTMRNVMPAADNAYNLGSPDNAWKNIYGKNFCFGSDCGLVTTTIIYNVTSTIAGLNIVSQSAPATRTLIWSSVDGPLYVGNTTTQLSPGWDINDSNDLVVGGDMYTFGRGFFQTGFTMNTNAGVVFGKDARNGLISYNSFNSSSAHFIWDADHYSKIIEIGDRYNWDHDYANADMPDPTLVIRSNARAHSGGAFSDGDFGNSVISPSQSLQLSYNSSSTNAHYLDSTYTNPNYYPVGGLVLSQSGGITLAPSAKTAMYLSSNAYVGVGTTTPNYPLTVSGTAYADNLQLSNGGTINNIPFVASSTYWQTYSTIVLSSYNSWNDASAIVTASSSKWDLVYNSSSTWNNTTAQVNASSSQWYTGYTLATQLNNSSSSWNNTAGYFDVNGSLLISHGGTGVTTTFSAGSIIFSDGSKMAENNNNFFWDNTNKRLGIGTNGPTDALSVNGNINIATSSGVLFINGDNVSQYFINEAGDNGKVWMSDGVGKGYWGSVSTAQASAGAVGTSTASYIAVYDGPTSVTGTSAFTLYSGGRLLMGGATAPNNATTTLTVSGTLFADRINTSLINANNSYLGTVLSGVWNGTEITNAYIASATYWGNAAATVYASSSYWQSNSALVAASSSKWDTAYSWGNHATQGYLKTESDPIWLAASSSYFKLSDWKATTTDALAEGTTNLYFTTARARNSVSSSIAAINYATSTGIFSLNSNYLIPLVASTTYWQTNSAIVAASSTKWDLVYNSSSTWNNTSALVAVSSTKWDLVYNSSSTWNNTTAKVNASSSQWYTGYTLATQLNNASSSWNNTAGYFNSSILKITNGGTNASTIGSAGTVAYSNGTSYNFTAVGNTGSVLMSNGAGTPTWITTSSLGLLSGNGTANYLLKYTSATTTAISSIYDNGGLVGIGTVTPYTATTTLTVSGYAYADHISTPDLHSTGNSYLGTVLSGVWNGTAIADAYIASAVTWNATTNQVNASSSDWYAGYTLATQLNNASSTWNNTTAQVNASSSQWYTGYTLATQLNNASSSWNNTAGYFNSSILKITNGGTNASTIGSAGTVAYSNGTSYNFTAVGNTGSVLMSNGAGTPTWITTSSLGLLSGNGTANYLLKYTSATTTAISSIYDNGGLVGIGMTTGAMALNVNGGVIATGGSETLNVSGAGTRMIWYPKKAAFRAGYVSGNNWDDFNIGSYSVAMGYNAIASNTYSVALGGSVYATGASAVAIGVNSTAAGSYAVALGSNNIASGWGSTVFGVANISSNNYSIAGGSNAVASGYASVAMGYSVTSSANYAIGMGRSIIAGGSYSAAFGRNVITGGTYAAVGMGYNVTSTGQSSIAFGMDAISTGNQALAIGYDVTASGSYSAALGRNMTVLGESSFGIGLSSTAYTVTSSNVFSVMGGNVGIGTTSPEFKLDINDDGGIIARGTYGSGNDLTTAGAGTRMIWYPKKAAFRAGYVYGDNWDKNNIGNYSSAFGYNSKANGNYAFAAGSTNLAGGTASVSLGYYNTASGNSSVAIGSATTASGTKSIALGSTFITGGEFNYQNEAWGTNSVAIGSSYSMSTGSMAFGIGNFSIGYLSLALGNGNVASGSYAMAFGNNNTASGDYSSALGYNMTVTGNTSFGISLDSGGYDLNKDNTMAIMGGNVGIGTVSPFSRLHITGDSSTSTSAMLTLSSAGANNMFESGRIRFTEYNSGNGTYVGAFMHYDGEGNVFNIGVHESSNYATSSDTNAISILRSNANVGIGTTSPKYQLTNDGAFYNSGSAYFNNYVGIGTISPDYKLEVESSGDVTLFSTKNNSTISDWSTAAIQSFFPNASAGSHLVAMTFGKGNGSNNRGYMGFDYAGSGSSSNRIIFGFQGSDNLLNILANGNVGIGSSTPNYKLAINGNGYLGASSWVYSSDRRLKENISYFSDQKVDSLSLIGQLKPATFDYINGDKNEAGFIAQDVQQVLPGLVVPGLNDMLALKTDNIIPYLVGAIQQQQAQIDSLRISLSGNSSTPSSTDLTVSGNIKTIKNIEVKGHAIFGEDSIGQAKILAGATAAHIEFKDVYNEPPIMTVTPVGLHTVNYGVENASTTGFDIAISNTTTEDIIFNWHAFATNKLKVHISDGNIEIVYDDGNGNTKSILPDYVNPNNTDPSWGPVGGCTNPLAENYNSNATDDDGSCIINSNSVSSSTADIVSTTSISSTPLTDNTSTSSVGINTTTSN